MKRSILLIPILFAPFALVCDNDDDPVGPSNNEPPVIQAMSDTTIALGDTLTGSVFATDADGDTLAYSMVTVLHAGEHDYWVTGSVNASTGAFWFVPRAQDAPERSVAFVVSDQHGAYAMTRLDVTVSSYCVDQANDASPGSHTLSGVTSAMGQEFVPSSNRIEILELFIESQPEFGGVGEFFVELHAGSLNNPAFAVSDTLVLNGGFRGVATFRFDSTALIPGNRYVMEIERATTGSWLIGDNQDDYALGRMILFGALNDDFDLWFREGTETPCP